MDTNLNSGGGFSKKNASSKGEDLHPEIRFLFAEADGQLETGHYYTFDNPFGDIDDLMLTGPFHTREEARADALRFVADCDTAGEPRGQA